MDSAAPLSENAVYRALGVKIAEPGAQRWHGGRPCVVSVTSDVRSTSVCPGEPTGELVFTGSTDHTVTTASCEGVSY